MCFSGICTVFMLESHTHCISIAYFCSSAAGNVVHVHLLNILLMYHYHNTHRPQKHPLYLSWINKQSNCVQMHKEMHGCSMMNMLWSESFVLSVVPLKPSKLQIAVRASWRWGSIIKCSELTHGVEGSEHSFGWYCLPTKLESNLK